MSANERQIGGTHYKTEFQHWDLVDQLKLGYLPAQITRYISRWRKKNGIEDIEKALHYVEKFIENEKVRRAYHHSRMEKFLFENRLQEHERVVFNMLINYQLGDEDRLLEAREAIVDLLRIVKPESCAPTDIPEDPQFKDNGDEWSR